MNERLIKRERNNKLAAIASFVSSACFYIVALIHFLGSKDTTMAITFFCLGSVYLNKMNNDK